MKSNLNIHAKIGALALTAALLLTGCGSAQEAQSSAQSAQPSIIESAVEEILTSAVEEVASAIEEEVTSAAETEASAGEPASAVEAEAPAGEAEPAAEAETLSYEKIVSEAAVTATGVLDATEFFSNRDLTQNADLSEAETYVLADGADIHITAEGVYVLTGTAANVTVYVEAGTEDKVQIVLDGAQITNDSFPCIYVTQADKVFITTTETENTLSVTGTFTPDGDTNTDGVIFSRDDVILNGLGTLTISSTDNGVVSKDDLKVTGGTYHIEAASKAMEANDSILISGGALNLTAGTDGLHAENDEDDSQGCIYICGGELNVSVGDDGIHAVAVVQIDGGTLNISGAEGIEGTYIQINGGAITVDSQDDGINGASKSTAYPVTIEITGGEVTVTMASGDTDGIDANGDLTITGGTIDVTGQSTFDCDGTVTFTGGTVICNGTEVDTIPTQMGGHGGFRGGW